jgi:hypothetical protein
MDKSQTESWPYNEELPGMRPYEFGDVNKLAGIGFFLSLIGAEVMGLFLYCGQKTMDHCYLLYRT